MESLGGQELTQQDHAHFDPLSDGRSFATLWEARGD